MIKLNKLSFLLFLLLSFLFCQQLFSLDDAFSSVNGYGIEKADDYSKLLNKPRKISQSAETNLNGDAVLSSDYHMVTEHPLQVLAEKLIDLDAAADIFKRITYSEDLTPDRSMNYPHVQEVHTSYKFMGMGPSYYYQVNVFFDQISDTEFAMSWQLTDPFDCGIVKLSGSWYLSDIEANSETFTYVRSYASSVIENPPAGLILFTNMFGEFEIRNTFKELISSVVKKQ